MMRRSLVSLLLLPLLFASFSWVSEVSEYPSSNVLVMPSSLHTYVMFGTQEGFLHVLDQLNGQDVIEPKVIGDDVMFLRAGVAKFYVATPRLITVYDQFFEKVTSIGVYIPFDVKDEGDVVYVADYKGLRKLKADGTRIWAFDCWGQKSNVVLDGGMVSFFCSKTLYLLGEDGSTLLKRRFKPLASNLVKKDTLFVFATVDKKVFAYDYEKDKVMWSYTFNTPAKYVLALNAGVLVVTMSGEVVSLSYAGKVLWRTDLHQDVSTAPRPFVMDGENYVVIGGSKKLVVLNTKNGEVYFSISLKNSVRDAVVYGNNVFYLTTKGEVGAYSFKDRGCSFFPHVEGTKMGYKPVLINGTFFSKAPPASVFVKVESGQWIRANVSGNVWSVLINPLNYPFGNLEVVCKVEDSAGTETLYSSTFIKRDEHMPRNRLEVYAPFFVESGHPFTVYVSDEVKNRVDDFYVYFNGKLLGVGKAGVLNVSVDALGLGQLVVKKEWYNSVSHQIFVIPPLPVIGGVSLLMLLVFIGLVIYHFKREGEMWKHRRGIQ